MDLLIATGNSGKVKEYAALLEGLPVRLLSLRDVDLDDMDVIEDGDSFAANAHIKATAYARASGLLTLADDSGLCVDALDGAPGIHSARYGGPGLDDAGRRAHLLAALANVAAPQRSAYFACVITLAEGGGTPVLAAEGRCTGHIRTQDSGGTQGFGYDALFQPDGLDVTFAEIDKATKNRISHRGQAVADLLPRLRAYLAQQA